MKYNFFPQLTAVLLIFLTFSCSENTDNSQPALNDYVSEFTTGVISRKNPVEIILNDPLTAEQRKPEFLKGVFSITPKINGKLEVQDDRKILFQPTGMFDPGTKYTVSLNLKKIFKADDKNKKFTFSFETIAPEVNFVLKDMDVDPHSLQDTVYEFSGTLLLSDWSDSTTVHNMIGFDKPMNIRWEKVNEARSYDFTFRPVNQTDRSSQVELYIRKNTAGFPKKVLSQIRIPGKSDFDVYSITTENDGDEYVEVIFTRNLAPDQDLNGLIEVSPGEDVSFSIEDNKAKIWFQNKTIATREITVHNGIRSFYGGRKLEKNSSHPNRYHRIISFHSNYPSLEFIGQGGILPEQNNLVVPFTATSLRGVIVRIIKVYENNLGQFLQRNQLSDGNELAAMGELLCRKIIFLDERNDFDLNQRNTFALDLKELITPEPGALYRVMLSYNFELSGYPCQGITKKTKRELIEENKKIEEQEKANFGNGNAYYYFTDQSWMNYKWEDRNDPCTPSYYVNKQISKNILHSNLGIIAKRGDRGKMFVSVNNIITAAPEGDVSVSVYSYQNQEIGKQTTWENGTTEFDLKSKEPFYIIARKKNEKGYLRMAPGENLSMSAFDVAGEEVKNGTKGFIYAERGVWRPGDTIFVSFILNNPYGDLPERHPVTFELFTPAGQLYWHKSLSTRTDNFYVFKPATSPDSPTGIWNGKITVGGVTFEKKFRVETIKPNRLSLNLTFQEEILKRDSSIHAQLKSQWLTGATAGELNYDIYTTIIPLKTAFKGYDSYVFDDPIRKFSSSDVLFSKGRTNNQGIVDISTVMKQGGFAPGLLRAQFMTKVYEKSGEFSINTCQKIYSPFSSYVGISSPQKREEALKTNENYQFELATVSAEGGTVGNQDIQVRIFKVEWYWWWSSDMSKVADYVSSSYNKPIKTLSLKTNNSGKTAFSLKVPNLDWGTYFIQATNTTSGHQTGIMAYFDSFNNELNNTSDKAMLLSLQTEKENYSPGEEVVVNFPSTPKSKAIITIEASGGILQHHEIDCQGKTTSFKFNATTEMQPNVYVSVTLLNPYASTEYDLPIRLYGVIPVKIYDKNSLLEPVINAPESVRPGSNCKITVSEKKGLPMTFTLAMVDEGLLELTNFKTPSPWNAFFAKEALGMRTWDMYNYVLGAYGGKIEQIFSIGGDDALNKGPKAIVNRFKPMVRFAGPFTLKPNENKNITVSIPEYIGKVRCMVIAGGNQEYGNAQKDIFVKQPLMVLGTLPRSLNTGDEIWMPATIFAMKKNMGKVTVHIDTNNALTILGNNTQEVFFEEEGTKVVWFKIKAKNLVDTGEIRLSVYDKGEKAEWKSQISINTVLFPEKRINNYLLKAGQKSTIELAPFGIPGSNKLFLNVAGIKDLNMSTRILKLYDNQYENLEQLVSQGFVALFMPKIANFSASDQENIEAIVKKTNSNIRNYIIPGGSFAFWPGGTTSTAWGSIYAFMYLNMAAERGYVITPGLRHECGLYQARLAREWKPVVNSPVYRNEQIFQAFRLFSLSMAHIPEKGAMNRLRQQKDLPLTAKWLLAAAYGIESKEAGLQILETYSSPEENNNSSQQNYASDEMFQEIIRLMTFNILGQTRQAHESAKALIAELQNSENYGVTSTAFGLMALNQYFTIYPPVNELKFNFKYEGKEDAIAIDKSTWVFEKNCVGNKDQKLEITNTSNGDIYVQSVLLGTPEKTEQTASANGLTIKSVYKDMDGNVIDITNLPQGTNLMNEVTITNVSGIPLYDLVLEQYIPVGWEIMNNMMPGRNNTGSNKVKYQNVRDNKVISNIELPYPEQSVRIVIYATTAYAGNFYLPPSKCSGIFYKNIYATTAGRNVVVSRNE